MSLQSHLIQLGLRFRLVESGLKRARIDCEKQVAFLHVGAILKITRDDYTTDLRLHQHSLVSRTCADFIEVKRYIFCNDLGHGHRTCRRLRRLQRVDTALKGAKQNQNS